MDASAPLETEPRPRRQTVSPFPRRRRLVTAAVRAGRRIVPMVGLMQVDVTEAVARLDTASGPRALTAFVVASVARAAARHPEVHAFRDWRGRLVRHEYVDVQTLVEIPTADGTFGLVHVVRDADLRSVAEIDAELHAAKHDPTSTIDGFLLDQVAPAAARVPGLFRAMYAIMARSPRARSAVGTVQVTAVGMYAAGGGFAIAPPSLASCSVAVGGLALRPWVVGDRVLPRQLLDLTVTIDHEVVDGAPATRFGADLRRTLETGAALLRPRG